MAIIIVATEKLPQGANTAEDYIELVKGQLSGYTFDESVSAVTLLGYDYAALSDRAEMNDFSIVQEMLVKKVDAARVVMMTITYTDDTVGERDALLAAFAPY